MPHKQNIQKEIIFSNINGRAQSAGRIRSNPKDIVIDQINSYDKISNAYLSSTEYKSQLNNLIKKFENEKSNSDKK